MYSDKNLQCIVEFVNTSYFHDLELDSLVMSILSQDRYYKI